MATAAENLQTALDNVCRQLADMTAAPKPTYSVDGESYSWGEHFNNLLKARHELQVALQRIDGPWEARSRGST